MGIDEQLIDKNTDTQEAEKAGEFRQAQRGGSSLNTGEEANNLRAAKKQKDTENKKADSDVTSKIAPISPFLAMTDRLLESAWQNIFASWGLTLLWVDIHVFLNKVFGPSAFREIGEEWISDKIKRAGGAKLKAASSMGRLVEGAGCGCLNLGCLFLVIFILSIVAMIVSGIENPFRLAGIVFGSLWNYLTGGK